MKMTRRISQLEKKFHVRVDNRFDVDLSFRVAGKTRSWAQQEAIRRFKVALADPRATEGQREQWREAIASIEIALPSQLERDHGRYCSLCKSLVFKPVDKTRSKCADCGKLVRRNGDGTVTG